MSTWDTEEIKRRYRAGEAPLAIALDYTDDEAEIREILHQVGCVEVYGYIKHAPKMSMCKAEHAKKVKQAVELIKRGMSISQATRVMHLCRDTIVAALGEYRPNPCPGCAARNAIPVLAIDPSTGKTVARYESMAAAAKALGVTYRGSIVSAAKGKRKTAYGYMWKYASREKSA